MTSLDRIAKATEDRRSPTAARHDPACTTPQELNALGAHVGVVVLFAQIDTPAVKTLNEIKKLREAARGTGT